MTVPTIDYVVTDEAGAEQGRVKSGIAWHPCGGGPLLAQFDGKFVVYPDENWLMVHQWSSGPLPGLSYYAESFRLSNGRIFTHHDDSAQVRHLGSGEFDSVSDPGLDGGSLVGSMVVAVRVGRVQAFDIVAQKWVLDETLDSLGLEAPRFLDATSDRGAFLDGRRAGLLDFREKEVVWLEYQADHYADTYSKAHRFFLDDQSVVLANGPKALGMGSQEFVNNASRFALNGTPIFQNRQVADLMGAAGDLYLAAAPGDAIQLPEPSPGSISDPDSSRGAAPVPGPGPWSLLGVLVFLVVAVRGTTEKR